MVERVSIALCYFVLIIKDISVAVTKNVTTHPGLPMNIREVVQLNFSSDYRWASFVNLELG